MCQPLNILVSPPASCPIGLSVLCHIGFSLHYFRVISNWLRVWFLLPLDVAWASNRIDGTPKQRRARISSRKLENNQTGKRLWHLLLLTFLPKVSLVLKIWKIPDLSTYSISKQFQGQRKVWNLIGAKKKDTQTERDDFPEAGRWRGKKQSSKSISKTLSRCSFLILFFVRVEQQPLSKMFLWRFFLGYTKRDMTLVSFRNNFQPHTQHTVYGWKLHSCYWMSLLFFSAGSNTTYYGQQPAFCNACDDKTGKAFKLFVKLFILLSLNIFSSYLSERVSVANEWVGKLNVWGK